MLQLSVADCDEINGTFVNVAVNTSVQGEVRDVLTISQTSDVSLSIIWKVFLALCSWFLACVVLFRFTFSHLVQLDALQLCGMSVMSALSGRPSGFVWGSSTW